MKRKHLNARSIFIFGVFFMLFNFPVLGIFNSSKTVFGIPSLLVYLTLAMFLLVGLLAYSSYKQHKST